MYGMFTNIWLMFMLNVGTYASPMDPMGYEQNQGKFHQRISSRRDGNKNSKCVVVKCKGSAP